MARRSTIGFLTLLATIIVVLGIPRSEEYRIETDREFLDRVCAGMYLTSDIEAIEAGIRDQEER